MSTPLPDNKLEDILDKHAEYYIKQTMKFFQENGESPALSKNNEGDLAIHTALTQLLLEARIDELQHLNGFPTSTYNSQPMIDKRIAKLKAQLTKKGNDDD